MWIRLIIIIIEEIFSLPTLNSHLMANVGITYKPGKSTMTNHPQNLEARVQALETQNKELQETVRQLMSKLDK